PSLFFPLGLCSSPRCLPRCAVRPQLALGLSPAPRCARSRPSLFFPLGLCSSPRCLPRCAVRPQLALGLSPAHRCARSRPSLFFPLGSVFFFPLDIRPHFSYTLVVFSCPLLRGGVPRGSLWFP